MRTALIACSIAIISLGGCASSPNQREYRSERYSEAGPELHMQRAQYRRDAALDERDELITSQIRAQFARDPDVDASDIDIDTYHGSVELSGYVDDSADIRRAVRIALATPGVRTVRNDMRVARPYKVTAR